MTDTLTLPEAAALLHQHPHTVEAWAREAKIPAHRVGRRYLFLRTELDKEVFAMTTLTIELPLDIARTVRIVLEESRGIRPIQQAIWAIDSAVAKALGEQLAQETAAEHPAPHVNKEIKNGRNQRGRGS